MKYIFALVCLIALASSQLKNRDGTCDTTNWSDYTDADCTDATKDVTVMTANVTAMTVCKDVAEVAAKADFFGKICDDTCGSKGTCASTWKAVKDAADKKMGELTNCTKEAICASMSDSSGSGSGDNNHDEHEHEECCLKMYGEIQMEAAHATLCPAEWKKMIDDLPADNKTAADAQWKTEYGHLSDKWAENKCDTYSGKSFDSVASSAGYKDSMTAMPASSWFTGVFGLLLALWVLLMK